MRSVYTYNPFDDGAYARISFLEQRQTFLDEECVQQAELYNEKLYKENTILAGEIHKIHKFLHSFTKRVEVRFPLIESTIEEITGKMQNLSLQ